MGVVEEGWGGWAPTPGAAPLYIQKDDHWTHFDNSVNAVSFGFVATAILISMFLVMAIFEKFLRTTSPPDSRRRHSDLEAQTHIVAFNSKLRFPSSPKGEMNREDISLFWKWSLVALMVSVNAREVSVVMPGNKVPTFIAHPAPVPCPPERVQWPPHQL